MGILSSDKFKPILFVGLGGNGGKIVNILANRLRRHPHWERIAPLTHFVAIDTNQNDLMTLTGLRPDCRFLISNLDARTYVERKRGEKELAEDTRLTQWFPDDYVPRSGMSPGAGQIRLESRLKLWYNLEDDRARIRQKISAIVDEMTGRENPWRDNEDRVIRVMVYGSVAGGTGSGGFLPIAYLLRSWIADKGWGRTNVTAVLTLPTTFTTKVRPQLHRDIAANGYAALKELEYLTRKLGYDSDVDALEFHYDPNNTGGSEDRIYDRPFTLVYLVDRPREVSIEKYEHAVADASYLQIFSPLLGAQAGEYDNYEKHQRQLALGHFSGHYGAFGTAVLHFPRNDVLRYVSLRYVSRALREFLCSGAEHPDFRVPYGDPSFERLAETEKARRIDQSFDSYVAWRAQLEADSDERGVYSAIHAQTGKGEKDLAQALRERLQNLYARLDELIDIPDVERQSINPGNPSISRPIAVLRQSYAESRSRVRGQYLEAQLADLRSGRFFSSFFTSLEVNPLAQRLFLIRLLRTGFITPYEDPIDGEYLKGEGSLPVDLEGEHVQTELKRLEGQLVRAANPGLIKSLTDRDNRAFMAVKTKAIGLVEELSQDCREELRRYFWRTFEGELRNVAETLLSTFRKVSEIADEQARLREAETERFRRDPGAFPDSDVAQYYLDAEVLRDDRRRDRLWHLLYTHRLDKSAYFDLRGIFDVITQAFQPVRDPDGRLHPRGASELVSAVREALEAQARGIYGRALEELGLDLASGLELEQRYIALLDEGADFDALRREGKLDDAVAGVPRATVRAGIADRLRRLSDECALLAHIDATKRDDPTVVAADVFYAGLHSAFATDEEDALGTILGATVSGLNFVPDWQERDTLVLYRALLGIPIYWFRNVQTELYPAYTEVRRSPNRSYPLHIEADWEREPGIPDLDPVEIRRAEERRATEEATRTRAEARLQRIRAFSECVLFGSIALQGDVYAWSMTGASQALGEGRSAAFAAFESLNPILRGDLEEAARERWTRESGSKTSRARLFEYVRNHGEAVRQLHRHAVAEGLDEDERFLTEEREVVGEMLSELGG